MPRLSHKFLPNGLFANGFEPSGDFERMQSLTINQKELPNTHLELCKPTTCTYEEKKCIPTTCITNLIQPKLLHFIKKIGVMRNYKMHLIPPLGENMPFCFV